MLLQREASLFPPWVILYMHNKPHKLMTRKQQSLTQIPGIIFFFYLCVYMCVRVYVLWFGCQHILLFVSSNLAIYRDSLLFLLENQMASRGMSLKKKKKNLSLRPPAVYRFKLRRATSGCSFGLLQVVGRKPETKRTHKMHGLLSGQDSTLFT